MITGTANATYAYDANFKRVKTVENGGLPIYTLYSRVTGGLANRDEMGVAKTAYVSAGDARVRIVKLGATYTPEYIHTDELGSPVAATDASGAVLWRERHSPFCRRLLAPAANDNNVGFTGHLEDKSTGLVYMQARYYDPLIGRFLSTDPVGYRDQMNLYAYVGNDPVNGADPTGKENPLGGGIRLWGPEKRLELRSREQMLRAHFASMQAAASGLNLVTSQGEAGLQISFDGEPGNINANELAVLSNVFPNAIGLAGGGITAATSEGAAVSSTVRSRLVNARPNITQAYVRPNNATIPAQRAAVQGKPCVDCGAITSRQFANHKTPLVVEYYKTGTINLQRVRSLEAVNAHCPTCSARQGAELARYSVQQRLRLGLEPR